MHPTAAQTAFWDWFKLNGARLAEVIYGPDEARRDAAMMEVREATEKVEEGIIAEFAQSKEGKPRQFIISADGRPERVDPVKDLVDAAPAMPGWEVVAFRQRMPIGESLEIAIENERVGPGDIWFRVSDHDDGLTLTLHVRGLTAANEKLRGLGASLLAEHAVGERDALLLLRGLDVAALPSDPAAAGLHPFRELVNVFEATKQAKYPPAGTLPIDGDSEWQTMEGTINDAPAIMLFHAGLRPVAGHPAYDHRLIVTIPFHNPMPNGLPTSEEYSVVADLGDRLSDALQQEQQSLLAMTITTQGRRDLVLYTVDPRAALQRLEALRATVDTHRIEPTIERDSYWGLYRSFFQPGEADEGEE